MCFGLADLSDMGKKKGRPAGCPFLSVDRVSLISSKGLCRRNALEEMINFIAELIGLTRNSD